jgi:hypothetical protein
MFDLINRFNTDDTNDLVGVYDHLIGDNTCDPFGDSAEAVTAFEEGDWEPLLLDNLADIYRTREIAVLAGKYVAHSDFSMEKTAIHRRYSYSTHIYNQLIYRLMKYQL